MPLPVELDPGPDAELDRLERAKRWPLLDAIDTAIATLAADPGSPEERRRSFSRGTFGMTVRTQDDDWLIIWESEPDAIAVRYIGPDPFA